MSSVSTDRVIRPDNGQRDELAASLRALAMDAVEQAQSGHPGAPMGMAVALWHRHLCHDPAHPDWPDRDRFVLSNGHASMLLYALLHLTGYDLPMQELRRFRQFGSRTPGHPEYRHTPGVETTTGPLGQGFANAVGMALAERLLGDEFNRRGHRIVDHYTYTFMGDGCLMEGISHEAASLAGTLKLDKLIALYDDNGISIDGAVRGWFADDTAARFRAYGWHVIGPVDGHDVEAISQAITQAKQTRGQGPSLILCRTTIGRGAPNRQGTAKSHGEPLGKEEIAAARQAIGWPHPPFEIPEPILARWRAASINPQRRDDWARRFESYRAAYPTLAAEFERRMAGQLPVNAALVLDQATSRMAQGGEAMATRKASQRVLALIAPELPELLGGSADLTGSNLTDFPGGDPVRADSQGGRHINWGVREFGMAAAMNGLALHGGFIPYGGTFLAFSDYSRNALRMAALMRLRTVHVLTHDSIGLGEDGPTHQPVEHAASLRMIPNLDVWRPCDGAETAVAWSYALRQAQGPSALLLSRQSLPAQQRSPEALAAIERGGYVLSDRAGARAVILATGSEVDLAIQAQRRLDEQGLAVRVVSLPCAELFDRQDASWRELVLGKGLVRIGVEAGVTRWWGQYGCAAALGVDGFGESAPAAQVMAHFGLTAQGLADLVQRQFASPRRRAAVVAIA
jgi:transketolase